MTALKGALKPHGQRGIRGPTTAATTAIITVDVDDAVFGPLINLSRYAVLAGHPQSRTQWDRRYATCQWRIRVDVIF
jgi:hypothetical protein